MRKVKIAQLGTSAHSHGNDIWNTLKKLPERFELAGYCFPEGERQRFPERMADFDGYRELTLDELLGDPTIEAVAVETEELYLTKYALLAARAGKHIHMEKPGGPDAIEFEKLIEAVKEGHRVFHIGYMYRYNPALCQVLAQAEGGELGQILSVEAQMNCLHPAATRQWLAQYPGGMTFFLGCHLIDLIFRLQGTPLRVLPLSKASGVDGVTAEDFGMVVLEYPHGCSFAKMSAVEVGGFPRRQVVVSGTKKTVEVKPLEFWSEQGFQFGMYSETTEYADTQWCYHGRKHKSDYYDRYETMLRSFADMVLGVLENPYTPEYEHELYKLLLQCCGTT